MHRPFRIVFKLDNESLVSEISLNRKTGEFFYFPKEQDFLGSGLSRKQMFTSHNDIVIHDDEVDHFSWHRDGTLHIKYRRIKEKSIIDRVEASFCDFDRDTLLPLFSHSVRDVNGRPATIISVIAGLNIIHNIERLPKPYSAFVMKGQQNNHISSVINSQGGLPFGYMFISIPLFIPIENESANFSVTVPLQEDDLLAVAEHLENEKKRPISGLLKISNLIPRTDQ